ncbi:MAG: hypothetical protein R6X25_06990 [Candidatus Krumholzibacteriia bacterium]
MKSMFSIAFCSLVLLLLLPAHVPASDNPILTVQEPLLGDWTFTLPTSEPLPLDVRAGAMLHFSWIADASHYGGAVDGYRYGWDLIDPDDPFDPGWASPFQADLLSAPAVSFTAGTHMFCAVARDDAGAETRGCIKILVDSSVPATASTWSRIKAVYGR